VRVIGRLVLCSQLVTDAEFRVLCLIVEKADADLKNSFASPAWLQRFLGGKSGAKRRRTYKGAENGRRTLRMVYTLIASLERKKFLRWHRGKGWQLCLPPDALAPGRECVAWTNGLVEPRTQSEARMNENEGMEEMKAEFVGGAFDGELVTLKVVRESTRNHRVLEWPTSGRGSEMPR